ncbi:inositol 2-dehydrogenase [Kushneria pakistanensis]|uniref:Inositol 2-dehydrogenase n=1 Tax=Kushneria pakistanensis TaxID=1508770 RepID=A0ABQ3FBB8_9GAMM|nr:Gfo/Idh/MocA family oxidoreductase [Kushneria pakistanensis]GHC16883.1 inositol 2-dehydrogenase [Kushneria pakistanensis]
MGKIRVGILGAGGIAAVHASILQRDERVEIVAVADMVEAAAKKLATTIGEHVVCGDSVVSLIDAGVDTVYVTTPNRTHLQPVLTCLKNSINVFCEKPMATSVAEGEQILKAACDSKAVYNLGMSRRFAHAHQYIKKLIDSGRLEPFSAHVRLNRGELLNPAWTADPDQTGGFLYETTIHQLDLLEYLFGPIKTLRCEACQAISDSELDNFAILFTFESGMVCTMMSSAHSGWSFPFERVEIFGRYATLETQEIESVRFSPGLNQKIESEEYRLLPHDEKGGYVRENQLFIDALVNDSEPPVPVEQAQRLNLLIACVYESAREQKEIDFSTRTREMIG